LGIEKVLFNPPPLEGEMGRSRATAGIEGDEGKLGEGSSSG